MRPHISTRKHSPPPAYYGARSATDSLLGKAMTMRPSRFDWVMTLVIWLFIFFIGRVSRSVWAPTDPAEWQRERLRFETDRTLWDSDRQRWERERDQHSIEVDRLDRVRERLRNDREQLSIDWSAFKKQEYRHQQQLIAFNRDRSRLEKDLDEMSKEKGAHELEKFDWNRDRASWARDRDEWERERRERHKEPYVYPLEANWDTPVPVKQCHSYGKREYSARLWNVPSMWGWIEACEVTPVEIHGVKINAPDRCENRGMWGGVVGYWLVDDEAFCEPYYDEKRDLGCVDDPGSNSQLRRVEAQILGIRQGDDWETMCSTTPTIIDQVEYTGPTYCVDKVHQNQKVAVWDYFDPRC